MLPKSKYSRFFDLKQQNDNTIIASCKSCRYVKNFKNAQASKNCLRYHLSSKHQKDFNSLVESEKTGNKNLQNEANRLKKQQETLKKIVTTNELIEESPLGTRPSCSSEIVEKTAQPKIDDLMKFWKNKLIQAKYPHLMQLYTKFCCAPSTSTESERLFSTVNTTLNDLRKSLSGEHLEQLVFNHHNILINGFSDV
uniref:Dimer_Tnp_hAT domain-containing protein n=1 Tax=Meloidogyne hapla TaxID=6305 RepID=A0A1I8BTK2_MELHA